MTDTTYNKVRNYIYRHHMIEAGDLVTVGVSGGADSVCLLDMLCRLRKEISYSLIVVHVDHGVRAESVQDAAYVERLCKDLDIPFELCKVDMAGYAAEHGISSEEAGRRLRYEAFEKALKKRRHDAAHCRIAVAHNANDRAETMLFHLFRGSGIKGLGSIRPVRESVIRPLLCLEREEIEVYLDGRHLKYCHDRTNEEDIYTRNRIRHHILPYAREEICRKAVTHMGELADILSETERYLAKQTEKLYQTYVEEIPEQDPVKCNEPLTEPGADHIKCNEQLTESGEDHMPTCLCVRGQLLSEDPVMYKRVLLVCLERLTPYRRDITGQHIADIVRLITGKGSKELSLPYGIKVYQEYDRFFLYRNQSAVRDEEHIKRDVKTGYQTYTVIPPAEVYVPGEGTYIFNLLENNAVFSEKQQNIPENGYTKWFDYDKITTALMLRTRQKGDYLTIDTALHTKSLKEYMINEKIPRVRRDSMYLLVDGAHVLWLPGYRISQRYKVEESTQRILQVQLRGGHYGRTN